VALGCFLAYFYDAILPIGHGVAFRRAGQRGRRVQVESVSQMRIWQDSARANR
jgi:hypothetical protein